MQKLVIQYIESDDDTYSSTIVIPFEYESKDKFCYDALEFLATWKKEKGLCDSDEPERYYYNIIPMFDTIFSSWNIDNFEKCIFTLEEWFEKYKQKKIF